MSLCVGNADLFPRLPAFAPIVVHFPLSVTWDAILRLAVVWELALLSAGSSRRGTVMAVI